MFLIMWRVMLFRMWWRIWGSCNLECCGIAVVFSTLFSLSRSAVLRLSTHGWEVWSLRSHHHRHGKTCHLPFFSLPLLSSKQIPPNCISADPQRPRQVLPSGLLPVFCVQKVSRRRALHCGYGEQSVLHSGLSPRLCPEMRLLCSANCTDRGERAKRKKKKNLKAWLSTFRIFQGSDEVVRVVAMDKDFHIDCYKCEVSANFWKLWPIFPVFSIRRYMDIFREHECCCISCYSRLTYKLFDSLSPNTNWNWFDADFVKF